MGNLFRNFLINSKHLQYGVMAAALIAVLVVASSTAVYAVPPSSVTRDSETRVNKLNSDLPTTGCAPSTTSYPCPRFPQTKQNEPTIAVNPKNPLNLIAGANDEQAEPPCQDLNSNGVLDGSRECPFAANVGVSGLYVSTDGGSHWTDKGILDTVTSAAITGWTNINYYSFGDPSIAFDAGGNAYYSTLAFPKSSTGAGGNADIVVAKAIYDSTNNLTGLLSTDWVPVLATVGAPVRFDDKTDIWVDTNGTSPFKNNVYVSWTAFTQGSDRIAVITSTDGGTTWSKPVFVSQGAVQGSVVRTAPDGTVYVAWEFFSVSKGDSIVFSKSTDGGKHFTRPATVANIKDVPNPLNGGAFRDATPKAGFRTNSFPAMTIAPDGAVYIAWGDNGFASNSRTEVLLVKSTDGGQTWTLPAVVSQRISSGTNDAGDQFLPWLTSAKYGDNIAVSVVYYDRSYDATSGAACTASCSTDNKRLIGVTVAVSIDGGASWGYTRADTNTSGFDPAGSSTNDQAAQFLGDYIYAASTGTHSAGNHIFVVWTDARNGFTGSGKYYTNSGSYGDTDIFSAKITWTA